MIRNTWRRGQYLMMDTESGLVHYSGDMVKIWNNTWVHESNWEERNPQEFIKGYNDPKALENVQPDAAYPTPSNVLPIFIGNTTIAFPSTGPAAHLFGAGGIEAMIVEGDVDTFVVS